MKKAALKAAFFVSGRIANLGESFPNHCEILHGIALPKLSGVQ
jgi:hypothetical protein